MSTPPVSQPSIPPPRGPAPTPSPAMAQSLRQHRRQTTWQILVPLGVFMLIILALAVGVVLVAAGASPELERYQSMSLIMLIIPTMIGVIILLLLAFGFVYLMARLLHGLPPYTQLAQAYAHLASVTARLWADRIASPMIKVKGSWAGWRALRRRLFG